MTISRHCQKFEATNESMANECEDGELQFSNWVQRDRGHFRHLFWTNKHATIAYCAIFWSFGMCVGFLGPTLWDLGCQTGTTLPTMTWLFLAQSLFTLIGSMISGICLHRFPKHSVMALGTIVIALSFLVIPFCTSMGSLAFVLAVMGFYMGVIDTTTNVSMLRLYGLDVSPFLQALHFFYGMGAFLSPMIAEPFLQNIDCTRLIDNSTIYSSMFEKDFLNAQKAELAKSPKSLAEAQKRMQVNHAFWIMAFLQVPVMILAFSLVFRDRMAAATGELDTETKASYQDMEQASISKPSSWKHCCVAVSGKKILVISTACLLLFFADGMQASFGGLIFTYARMAVKRISLQQAADLDAVFWGSFASGRLVSIFAALYLAPGFMLFCDILGSLTAMLFLLTVPHNLNVLYLGTSLFGLFLSSMYPSTISLTEQFVDLGPSATSCMIVGAATGEMIYPVALGNLFNHFGYMSFLAVGNVTLCLMVFVFFGLWMAGMCSRNHKPSMALLALWMPRIFRRGPTERTSLLQSFAGDGQDTTLVTTTRYSRMKNEDSCQSIDNAATGSETGSSNARPTVTNGTAF